MTQNAIELKTVTKRYKNFALQGASFVIPEGYVMGLIGPNGAGKTTIIKLIMNLIRRDAGEIRVFGRDNRRDEVAIKSRIGFVYDEPCFHGESSLKDIKRSIAPFYERWDDLLFASLMDEFELSPKQKFKRLSHGMKMKLTLALALSHHADLLIMDEPTAGLDPVFRQDLLRKLSALLQDERKTILFSTHVTSDLEQIADFITFVRAGEILFSTAKDELLENWGVVKGGPDLLDDAHESLFKGHRRGAYGVEALTSNVREARRCFGTETVVERASIEDIMFLMTRGGNHA